MVPTILNYVLEVNEKPRWSWVSVEIAESGAERKCNISICQLTKARQTRWSVHPARTWSMWKKQHTARTWRLWKNSTQQGPEDCEKTAHSKDLKHWKNSTQQGPEDCEKQHTARTWRLWKNSPQQGLEDCEKTAHSKDLKIVEMLYEMSCNLFCTILGKEKS